MTTPASGPISFNDVINEFKGASSPYSRAAAGSPFYFGKASGLNQYALGASASAAWSMSNMRKRTVAVGSVSATQNDVEPIWTGDSNIDSSSGASTTISANGEQPYYMFCTDWGFALPSNAVVRGIVVGCEGQVSYGGDPASPPSTSLKLSLTKNGFAAAGNVDYLTFGTSYELLDTGGSDGAYFFGKWGLGWTYSDINASTFGVGVKAYRALGTGGYTHTLYIRNLRIRVHYTTP